MSQREKRLSEFLPKGLKLGAEVDVSVSGLCTDSRVIEPGDLFIATQGHKQHGNMYAADVVAAGAVAILEQASGSTQSSVGWYEHQGRRVPYLHCSALPENLATIADSFYQHPSQQMSVVGITGTNGKTSCAIYLAQAWDMLATKKDEPQASAVVGTLGMGRLQQLEQALNTTPEPVTLQKKLAQFKQAGIKKVAMEVSSHALSLGRVEYVSFEQVVFTNLSRDHLDFHLSMSAYGEAKKQLFMGDAKQAVINLDDEYGRKIYQEIAAKKEVLGYGLKPQEVAGVYATDIQYLKDGIELFLETPQGKTDCLLPLMGRFNISNALACVAALLQQGETLANVVSAMEALQSVPGRLQKLPAVAGKAQVIVDYAHTPDALENALLALEQHQSVEGHIWCVFGCGGDRDKEKRHLMGNIAEALADYVVLTSDNPRNEEPENIIKDIKSGFSTLAGVEVIEDRAQAIAFAIEHASEQDLILIAGKGHEDYQEVKGERVNFSDVSVAEELLHNRQGGASC